MRLWLIYFKFGDKNNLIQGWALIPMVPAGINNYLRYLFITLTHLSLFIRINLCLYVHLTHRQIYRVSLKFSLILSN